MNKQLTKEEYEFLMEQKDKFDSLINSQYMSALDGNWLSRFGKLFTEYFNEPFKANCGACLKSAMTRMHNKMKEYQEKNISQ